MIAEGQCFSGCLTTRRGDLGVEPFRWNALLFLDRFC